MIEGLRVAPHYFDARNKGAVVRSCEDCKATTDVTTRQHMGCGYEARIADAQPWSPRGWADRGTARPEVCPGYTTSLPAVGEFFAAHPQWKAGTLSDYLDGERPTSPALDCLAVLDSAIKEHESDAIRYRDKDKP